MANAEWQSQDPKHEQLGWYTAALAAYGGQLVSTMDDTALFGTARAPWAAVANLLRRLASSAAVVVCITILVWALFNDRLVATPGPAGELADVVQQHQLHGAVRPLHLCPLCAVPGNLVANWVLAVASLVIYATVGAIYLIPLLFTCLLNYIVVAVAPRPSC